MEVIADLHIHSHFSIATARDADLEHLDLWGRYKGVQVVGTGDCTHPQWLAELAAKLEPAAPGVYTLKPDLALPLNLEGPGWEAAAPVKFVITGEVSTIYKKAGKVRKVHLLLVLPDLVGRPTALPAPGPPGQRGLRRPPHPGPGRPVRPGPGPGDRSPGPGDPGPHLDSLVLRFGQQERLRFPGGVLRGQHRPHPCRGDRVVFRPRHELAGLRPGPLRAGVQFRRPLPPETGPGGQYLSRRPDLSRPGPGLAHPGGLRGHPGVFSPGRQVPPGRPPALRPQTGAGRGQAPGRSLSPVRQAPDPGGDAPRPGPGRPPERGSPRPRPALSSP